jgi:uncharacterized delta-60 repeat protein
MWSLIRRNALPANPARRTPFSFRPRLEALEDRCLLSGGGALDPTFGNGAGYVISSQLTAAGTTLIQPDGKIVAVGMAGSNTNDFGATRFNADGTVDTSFGSGGSTQVSFGSLKAIGPRAALYPQAGTANDGKIVQEGYYNGEQVLARYNANGTLDTTFGTGGVVLTAFPGLTVSPSCGVVVTSGGQIVAFSDDAMGHFALARYNADGTLDNSFGQGGEVMISAPVLGDSFTNSELLQQPDGKLIVVTDQTVSNPANTLWALLRFNANGTLDTSFGNQGIVTTAIAGGGVVDAALYPNAGTPNDGKIVVLGTGDNPGDWQLARYNTNGTLDSTFGNAGVVQAAISGVPNHSVALDAKGRIVADGYSLGGPTDTGELVRFNSDGTQDMTFGSGGLVTLANAAFRALAVYPNGGTANDGKIVAIGGTSGGTTNGLLVARYLSDSAGFTMTGFPSTVTAGTASTITVTAINADGSTNTGYLGTVHFTSSDPHAVLPADYTFTAADQGVHTFTATLKTAGFQSITVTDTTTSTMLGGESSIMVQPAAASQFVLSAPSSVSRGSKFSLKLTVEDAFGNVVTGYVGTVHFSSSDGTATLPADYTFTAGEADVVIFTKVILRKRGTQTITATDTQNSALTGTDSINVT